MRISLRRLLAYVTVICLVLGAIATFPDTVEALVRIGGGSLHTAAFVLKAVGIATLLVTPVLVVCVLFTYLAPHTKMAYVATALGACVGLFFSPAASMNAQSLVMMAYGLKPSWQSPTLLYDVTPPAITAFTTGLLFWVIATLQVRKAAGKRK